LAHRGAVEVLEDGEAALQQVGAKRLGFAVGQGPKTGLPHERERILEQIRIVERQDLIAVVVDVEIRQLADDRREVLLRARVVVTPRVLNTAVFGRRVGGPAQPDKGEPAVVADGR
jgi:hypothetical protein